jgi:beta-phosphoglucomutase
MIRAVVFDMDGVLIDAKEWHYEALNRALALVGYTITREEHETTFDGLPTKKKLDMLALRHGLPRRLHPFLNEMKQQYTMDMVYQLCKPTFHHEYALSRLKRAGYKLAVASNSIRNTVAVMMEKAHLAPYLDLQLSNEDVSLPKPHPEIYTKAIRSFGLTPAEVLIVEDNENGIRAATASGANVLVVRDVNDVTLDNILSRVRDIETPARRAA